MICSRKLSRSRRQCRPRGTALAGTRSALGAPAGSLRRASTEPSELPDRPRGSHLPNVELFVSGTLYANNANNAALQERTDANRSGRKASAAEAYPSYTTGCQASGVTVERSPSGPWKCRNIRRVPSELAERQSEPTTFDRRDPSQSAALCRRATERHPTDSHHASTAYRSLTISALRAEAYAYARAPISRDYEPAGRTRLFRLNMQATPFRKNSSPSSWKHFTRPGTIWQQTTISSFAIRPTG